MRLYEYDKNAAESLSKTQISDLKFLKDALEDIIHSLPLECLKEVLLKFNDVLKNCDLIDYQDDSTVLAYAFLHLLDRYHRFQLIQKKLAEQNLLCWIRNNQVEILDVGTGPAPALMAFSDYYEWLSLYTGISIKETADYVEQSQGFRNFLHRFCEYALQKEKEYHIPFHCGSFENFSEFNLQKSERSKFSKEYIKKYRYNIVIFSNFLTNMDIIKSFTAEIKKVAMSVRNYGLVIVVGASPNSDKYSHIYDTCDMIINKNFKNRKFCGYWKKFEANFEEYYSQDEQGKLVQEYFKNLTKHIEQKKMWNILQPNVQSFLKKACSDKDRTVWYVDVYQKHVWPRHKKQW